MMKTKTLTRSKLTSTLRHASLLAALALLCGCHSVRYQGPNGERFSRVSIGTQTSLSSLMVEAGTNGVRRLELRGYQHDSDSTQALGAVTEAAVRAALQGK